MQEYKMNSSIEVKTIARETIKPASPTPHHLRNLKLSLLDQIIPVEYTAVILFYKANGDTHHHSLTSQHLKQSLSETLTRFYQFAGKIKDHIYIECNDNGVEYVEAQANCLLSDILQKPDQKLLREFLPIELESPKAGSAPLLLVKVTFFKCGAVAIGNCLSHKIGDGCTTSTVINSWAAIARGSGKCLLNNIPEYNAASIFPPDDSLMPYMDVIGTNYITKRFVFDESNIDALRTKTASASVPKPTRVEAVAALIWKCTIAASRSIRGFPRVSLTMHSMNLRKMVSKPLPDSCVGNFVGDFYAQTREKEIELQDLVCKLRKGKDEFSRNGLQAILEKKSLVINRTEGDDQIDVYMYSDLSRLPKYETDFGWGKPIWVTIPNYMHNMVMLLGTRDGTGMEALVSLSKEDMALFEHDKELLAFAASNPSVLPTSNQRPRLLSDL